MKARSPARAATTPAWNVVAQLDPALDLLASGKRLSAGMSAVVKIGDTLWLVHDETVAVERLVAERNAAGTLAYGGHRRFALADFVRLAVPTPIAPGGDPPEADLEGLSFCDGYLWVAGSHSALRDGAKGRTSREAVAALAKVRRAGNRFLLARIPVDTTDGTATLVRRRRTPDRRELTAARLPGGRKNDALTRVLRDDPHLGPFVSIPSKDNGLDIEGLAAAPGGRLFLGLRGPVIDGWACVLEMHVGTPRPGELALQPIAVRPGVRARYRKHFLDLGGAGVRDLCFAGRDLLVLTGPPMRGKGTAKIRCWTNALADRGERLLHGHELPALLELPYRAKKDHAEGIAVLAHRDGRLLVMVIYDSADHDRVLPPAAMKATVHALALP